MFPAYAACRIIFFFFFFFFFNSFIYTGKYNLAHGQFSLSTSYIHFDNPD